ncbi:MAG: hypothetical protein WDA60_17250 [Acidimicrobiia bacterium]|jgi:hypothetical protein
MIRSVRRLLGLAAVAAVASVGLVGLASVPAGADTFGYTIQVQVPNGAQAAGPQCRLAKVDLATGAVTGIGSLQSALDYACANDLAFSPAGVLYGIADTDAFLASVDSGETSTTSTTDGTAPVEPQVPASGAHLVRFDTATGGVTDLGELGTPNGSLTSLPGPGGITFDASGNLFVYMVGAGVECGEAFCLFQVDPANPANATLKASDPQGTYLFGLTASCGTGMFTIEDASTDASVGAADDVGEVPGGNTLDRVDPVAGKATPVGAPFAGGRLVQSLDFGADGVLYGLGSIVASGVTSPAYLFRLDPATGAATDIVKLSNTSPSTLVWALAVSGPACPQPAVVTPSFTG